MPQTVHLQYNSPMGLYSKETAVEQFQQQIGENPGDLPAPDKHFDPSKSATLRYLKESERDTGSGDNFFEKVAQAEAPNVPYQSEPGWARTAREKSERARSKTPADPYYRPASSPAPSNHPIHLENARDHAEKNRVFTHNINEPYGRSYYDAAHSLPRYRRSHSAGHELSNRGYELGGMDYTAGLHVDHGTDYQYYEEPQRKPQPPKLPPGYELGGTDFYKGNVSCDNHYRGHGPDPPRLRPKYTADPHDPCNVAVAPNIDDVDANLLVGDTLSNQKIKHEVRHIDQSQFGTSFGPTQGFKRDHQAFYRQPEPTQPVVYSLSANKNLARSQRSSAPPEQRDVWNVSHGNQYEVDKEVSIRTLLNDEALRAPKRETSPFWANRSIQKHQAWQGKTDPRLQRYETYITEPNWRRNVDQRRLAWERRAFETEQRLSRPVSDRVAPGVPPAWHAEAEHKHQQWQQQADNMNQNTTQGSQNYFTENGRHYTSSTTGYPVSNAPTHAHAHGHDNSQTNAGSYLNSGYNSNQVDYLLSHKDRYNEGPHYQPPIINSSNGGNQQNQYSSYSSSQTKSVPVQYSGNQQHNSAGTFNEVSKASNYNKNYQQSTTTTTTTQQQQQPIALPAASQNYSSNYHSSSTTTTTQPQVQQYRPSSANYNYSSNYHNSSKTTTTTQQQAAQPQPIALPSSQNYSSNYHSSSTTTTTQPQAPVQQQLHVSNPQNYSTSYHTESHSTTGPTILHSPGGQSVRSTEYSSSRYNKQESKTTTTTTQPIALPAPTQNYSALSNNNYHSSSTTTTTTQQPQAQPVFQTTTLPITRNTSYNYSQREVSTPQSKPTLHQESFTSHTEKNTSSSTPRYTQQPASHQYENYLSSRKEESRREETTSRPVSQLSQYSESRNYKRNYEEKTETTTIPAVAPATQVTYKDLSNAQSVDDVFNKRTEMNESLPIGSLSNTHNNTEGGYRDVNGHDVSYKREHQTSADPGRETALLKEEEKRVVETPLEPGVISRHVTTKYYKKKTVTDTTTTTA